MDVERPVIKEEGKREWRRGKERMREWREGKEGKKEGRKEGRKEGKGEGKSEKKRRRGGEERRGKRREERREERGERSGEVLGESKRHGSRITRCGSTLSTSSFHFLRRGPRSPITEQEGEGGRGEETVI